MLAVWWLLRVQGRLWRETVSARAGITIESLSHALDGEVRPRWAGWEIRARGVRVAYVGGLFGLRTRVRQGSRRWRGEGLRSAEEVTEVLQAWERPGTS